MWIDLPDTLEILEILNVIMEIILSESLFVSKVSHHNEVEHKDFYNWLTKTSLKSEGAEFDGFSHLKLKLSKKTGHLVFFCR